MKEILYVDQWWWCGGNNFSVLNCRNELNRVPNGTCHKRVDQPKLEKKPIANGMPGELS